jgi:hypothetical protein
MAKNGKLNHADHSLSYPTEPRTDAEQLGWSDAFAEVVLAARAYGIGGVAVGARWGATFGIALGFVLGVIGAFVRGKNGLWNDVIIQVAYGIVLLSFSGMLLGGVFGAIVYTLYSAGAGILRTLLEIRDVRHQTDAPPPLERQLFPGIRSMPAGGAGRAQAVEQREAPDLALSDPDLR